MFWLVLETGESFFLIFLFDYLNYAYCTFFNVCCCVSDGAGFDGKECLPSDSEDALI